MVRKKNSKNININPKFVMFYIQYEDDIKLKNKKFATIQMQLNNQQASPVSDTKPHRFAAPLAKQCL
jgi:hypothetical protein